MINVRLKGIYFGSELGNVLNIMRLLNEDDFDGAAKEVNMLRDLGGNGPKFADMMNDM